MSALEVERQAPAYLVTDEMHAVGREVAVYGGGSVDDVYRAMAAKAPVSPTWDEIGAISLERDAAIARAEAAEGKLAGLASDDQIMKLARRAVERAEVAENELADERICTRGWQDRALAAEKWRDELGWGNQLLGKELAEETKLRQYWRETAFMEEKRAKAAETRLAERDASAKRWVRLGCVLTLLLPLTAHAADAPPTPPPQVVSATIPQPVEPPLQPVTLSPDDYRQLINSRINELIRQDPVAQMLIAHQNAAQAKVKPGG